MKTNTLSVREIQKEDIDSLVQYWVGSDPEFMISMGVDLKKLPAKDELTNMLNEQLSTSYKEKKSYCIIWLLNNEAIGHSNINKIIFGEEAFMHLHLWTAEVRQKGFGNELVKLTLPYFFKNLQLKKLYCEPFALNPAPNKTLEKVGFSFIKKHIITPGWINFEQPVNLWEMTYDRFKEVS